MTEQLRQSLSAVVDGEADAFELRRVLDELDRDPELRAAWDRYHLIGSVIRGERTVRSHSAARELASRVPRAVRESLPGAAGAAQRDGTTGAGADSDTDPHIDPNTRDARRAGVRRRTAVGLALAASVMIAAIVGFQPFDMGRAPAGPVIAAALTGGPDLQIAAAPVASAAELSRPSGPRGSADRATREASLADLRRARAYMLQHAQQQGLEQRGVISLVKMATYQAP